MPETDFTFPGTADEAERQTLMRNVAGTKLSDRLWNLSQENQRNINTIVQGSVRVGRDLVSAGKEILNVDPGVAKVKIPKYVQELKNAADTAKAFSDNSILQKTVKKYESYINKLTRGLEPAEIQKRYAHLGIRGASRMLVKRLQSQNQEVFDSAVDKWVKRKASYQARVVARNETNEAHWRALQAESAELPFVTGFRWNLGSHPEYDICDTLAGKVYTQRQLDDLSQMWGGNSRPHPNCLLPGQKVLMSNGEQKPIETICGGEIVIGSSGRPCRVIVTHRNAHRGIILKIHSGNGSLISLTGNHQIYVVGKGWIEAERIEKGMEILEDKSIIVSPDIQNYPPIRCKKHFLDKISTFLFRRGMPISAIDLDCDFLVGDSDINIEFSDGQLRNIGNAEGRKNFAKSNFIRRLWTLLLNSFSLAQQKICGFLFPSDGIVRRLNHGFPFIRIAGGPDQVRGLRHIPIRQTEFNESPSKAQTGDVNSFGQLIDTFPGKMPPVDLHDIKISNYTHRLIISFASVKSIEKLNYCGPVYNLTVENDHAYWVQGILVHNCNCFLTQEVDQDYFKNYTPSADLMQQVRDDPRFEEFHSWASAWLGKIGAGALPALSSLTMNRLLKMAQDLEIERAEDMTKDQLIRAINQARQE